MVLVGEAARLFHATARDGRAFSGDACAGLLRALLYLIAGEREDPARAIGRAEWLVERARGVIHREWATLEGPSAIAARCGVSHAHLCRLFRERMGASPGSYLQQIRMRHAARALSEHPEPLATVAARLGFADQFAFSKCFKRVMGMSPRHYQRRSAAP
jgi:AraC-like DNA-binding protein